MQSQYEHHLPDDLPHTYDCGTHHHDLWHTHNCGTLYRWEHSLFQSWKGWTIIELCGFLSYYNVTLCHVMLHYKLHAFFALHGVNEQWTKDTEDFLPKMLALNSNIIFQIKNKFVILQSVSEQDGFWILNKIIDWNASHTATDYWILIVIKNSFISIQCGEKSQLVENLHGLLKWLIFIPLLFRLV